MRDHVMCNLSLRKMIDNLVLSQCRVFGYILDRCFFFSDCVIDVHG